MENKNERDSFYAKTRKQWRQWLEKNGEKKASVWLVIYHKKSTTPGVSYVEAVEEGLCFGWIDSKANKRDEESYYQYFSKRKPNSNWSKSNIERVERLTKEGLMRPEGQEMVDLAKASGRWPG
jgi:uncharacterized protein YdeI (YjbR/CyaY-like superfamily)